MKTKTAPALIGLGSARAATRADRSGEKMELNPVFHYTEEGARASTSVRRPNRPAPASPSAFAN